MHSIWHILQSFKIGQIRIIISENYFLNHYKCKQFRQYENNSFASISIFEIIRQQRYGSKKQTWTIFYLTTQLGNLNSNKLCLLTAVNQICTFIVLPMPFECKCKYCWDLYKSWQNTKNNFACTLVIMCESWKHLIIMVNHVLYNMVFYQ